MSKPKYKTNNKTITITIPIKPNDALKSIIYKNARMYNIIRNDFVENLNKFKGEYNMYDSVDINGIYSNYYHTIEFVKDDNKVVKDRYRDYCVGLSESVKNDFKKAIKTIRTKNRKVFRKETSANLGEFHFKKFDENRYTFKVTTKQSIHETNGNVRGRVKVLSKTGILFTIRAHRYGRPEEYVKIKLKEDLYDDILTYDDNPTYIRYYKSNNEIHGCTFNLNDIREVCFKYECGRYYILLFIRANFNINKKSFKDSKHMAAGIDTGIRHPITIYDGTNIIYLKMDDKISRRVHYLERRIRRLQGIKDMKIKYNKDHNIPYNSNNVRKIRVKTRRLFRKIINIKKNWIKNTVKWIVTRYSTIVVDGFETPEHKNDKSLPRKVIRHINYTNRFHRMFDFNEYLKYASIKYGILYKKAPKDTTRTCSICGHMNPHPSLEQKYIICESCNQRIERDLNAAKNCYAAI